MKKFTVSEDLTNALSIQQTQLMVTTVVSTVGLAFVALANLITVSEDAVVGTFIGEITPEELEALEED